MAYVFNFFASLLIKITLYSSSNARIDLLNVDWQYKDFWRIMQVMIKPISNKKNQKKIFWIKEAQTGFEPVDTGVADHCLTTWLLRHKY